MSFFFLKKTRRNECNASNVKQWDRIDIWGVGDHNEINVCTNGMAVCAGGTNK